jgi:hypothetical protein
MLLPPSVFYRQRIEREARTGEPELAVLAELVPRGGISVDVGANVGFFAYALADIADRVFAFEPNPDYAFSRVRRKGRCVTHSMTSSARCWTSQGTSRWSAFAVLRLTTSVYLFGN